MSEWLAVEAIVRQRDREATAASIARLAEPKANAENNHEVHCFYTDSTRVPIIYFMECNLSILTLQIKTLKEVERSNNIY